MKPIVADLIRCVNEITVPTTLKEVGAQMGEDKVVEGASGILLFLLGIPKFDLPYDLRALPPGATANIRLLLTMSPACAEVFRLDADVLDFRPTVSDAERREIVAFVKASYKPRLNWA